MFVLEQRLRRRPRPPHPRPPRRTRRQNRSTLPTGPRRRQTRLHAPLPPQRPPHRPRRPAPPPRRPGRPLGRLIQTISPFNRQANSHATRTVPVAPYPENPLPSRKSCSQGNCIKLGQTHVSLPESVGAPLVGALRGLLWRPNLDAIAQFSLPLRGQEGSKMSSAPLRGQKKVFFAPLRAPSRTKKVFFLPLRGLLWRPILDAFALFSLPLRGQEGSKMFSVPLRGPPWTKKGFLRAPSRPFADKKGVLPAPSRAIVASELRCNCPVLPAPPWTRRV